jgi:hypothetical protein
VVVTQLECDPHALSNWFDDVLRGIGRRGSSFTDIDRLTVRGCTHDGHTRRYLYQEFKRPHEACADAQWWVLYDLAREPNATAWLVRQGEDLATVEWTRFHEVPEGRGPLTMAAVRQLRPRLAAETLTLEMYRQRYDAWWAATEADRFCWSDYAAWDTTLRDYIAAELARERIALHTLRADRDHWHEVACRLHQQLRRPGPQPSRLFHASGRGPDHGEEASSADD